MTDVRPISDTDLKRLIELRDDRDDRKTRFEDRAAAAKTAKKLYDEARDRFEAAFDAATTPENLPLLVSQTDVLEKAQNDPVARQLSERLIELGHDVNVNLVFGYTPEQRQAAQVYVDKIAAWQALTNGQHPDAPMPADVEVPAFLLPQLDAIVGTYDRDVIRTDLLARGIEVTDAQTRAWGDAQWGEVADYLSNCEKIEAELKDRVTQDDLPSVPRFVLDGIVPEATDEEVASVVEAQAETGNLTPADAF